MPDFLGALDSYVGDIGARRGRRRGGGSRAMARGGSPSFRAASNRANRVAAMVRPDLAGAPARDAALLPAGFPKIGRAHV
jgi:hypothetical protein